MADRQQMQGRRWQILGCEWLFWLVAAMTLVLAFAAFFYPILARHGLHNPPSPASRCMMNLKQVANGTLIYAHDHDERLPPLSRWNDRVYPYVNNEDLFKCPLDRTGADLSYGMNPGLSAVQIADFPEDVQPETVLFYEGTGQIVIERHNDGANYAFLDRHVKWLADPPEGLQPMQVIER